MTRRPALRAPVAAGAIAILLVAAAGCDPSGQGPAPPEPTADVIPAEPSSPTATVRDGEATDAYRIAAARQEERLRRLRFVDSRGVIEVRWTDADGQHFEQGDLRLHAVLPHKTSIQISKGVKKLAHIGSDGDVWWIFQLDSSPTTLDVRPWSERSQVGMSVVSPGEILVLLGLAPFPAADEVVVRADQGTLVVEPSPDSRPDELVSLPSARYVLDRSSLLPARIELLDGAGTTIASSELSEYESAPADGISAGDYPKLATRVVVSRVEGVGGGEGNGSLRLTLDQPTARSAGIKPRLFDLAELQASMQPDDVIWREDRSGQ